MASPECPSPPGSLASSSWTAPAGSIDPGLPTSAPSQPWGRVDRPGWRPGPASLGPRGPPGLPSDIHLTLSASLTESTPIRGKRLFPHPPTHSRSLSLPAQPPRLHRGLPQAPLHMSPPHPAGVHTVCVCVTVCGWGLRVAVLAPQVTRPQGVMSSGRCSASHARPEL